VDKIFGTHTINLEALFDGSNPFEEGGSVHYTADDVSPNEPAFWSAIALLLRRAVIR
jgi:hypothetical protein